MFTLKDLSNASEDDAIWKLLKQDSLREKLFDLILDAAFREQKAEADVLTPDALRASSARIEFAHNLRTMLPKSPEETKKKKPLVPQPVE